MNPKLTVSAGGGHMENRIEQVRQDIRAILYRIASYGDACAMGELRVKLDELRALRGVQRSPQGPSRVRLVA